MSHFQCPECGANILEGSTGEYITGCEHYPMRRRETMTKANQLIKRARKLAALADQATPGPWKANRQEFLREGEKNGQL